MLFSLPLHVFCVVISAMYPLFDHFLLFYIVKTLTYNEFQVQKKSKYNSLSAEFSWIDSHFFRHWWKCAFDFCKLFSLTKVTRVSILIKNSCVCEAVRICYWIHRVTPDMWQKQMVSSPFNDLCFAWNAVDTPCPYI